MKPLNDYIIIKPQDRSESVKDNLGKSGLVYQADKEGEPNIGEVVAISEDVKLPVKVGDKIVFDEAMPRGFRHKDEGYLFVKSEFVIAII